MGKSAGGALAFAGRYRASLTGSISVLTWQLPGVDPGVSKMGPSGDQSPYWLR